MQLEHFPAGKYFCREHSDRVVLMQVVNNERGFFIAGTKCTESRNSKTSNNE